MKPPIVASMAMRVWESLKSSSAASSELGSNKSERLEGSMAGDPPGAGVLKVKLF